MRHDEDHGKKTEVVGPLLKMIGFFCAEILKDKA